MAKKARTQKQNNSTKIKGQKKQIFLSQFQKQRYSSPILDHSKNKKITSTEENVTLLCKSLRVKIHHGLIHGSTT